MKNIILIILAFSFGCATVAPPQSFKTDDGETLIITAKAKEGILRDKITIRIDGEKVAEGTLHELKTEDNYYGTYKGHKVLAECYLVMGNLSNGHRCHITIDNQRAGNLSF